MREGAGVATAHQERAAGLEVCLVAHAAYGALVGTEEGHVGGVERQTTLMARWLAAHGRRVGLVTWSEGPAHDEVVDGVHVFKTCRRDAGWSVARFFHPRWTALNRALARADARTYYHNCAEYVTGQVAWWAGRHGRRFVYSVASDMDCDRALPDLRTRRERALYLYGLRRADRVIAQTETQVRMLWESFGVRSSAIPMPCMGPVENEFVPPSWDPAGRVLWVGRICPVKRPDRFLEVADACPDVAFDMVGPLGDDAYAAAIAREARSRPNVTLHGRANRVEMDAFYRQASVLLCTSDREGFPNTFIEAWSHGVPIVSTHDPDGTIARLGLGAVAAPAAAELASALRAVLASCEAWTRASAAARRHYLRTHTVDAVMQRFEPELVGSEESGL
jgi:glycosyltransferase involved in cell wall biosynthesis